MTSNKHAQSPILPNAILGVLGGGQLGKMFCSAAQSMGYRVWVLDPDPHCPTSVIADHHVCADFEDSVALETLGTHCSAITTEFENVAASSLAYLANYCPVSPPAESVSIIQHRFHEKLFLRNHGLPTAPFWKIETQEDLHTIPSNAFPAILKVSRLGYDGKGQITLISIEYLKTAWENLGCVPCILETRLALELEISVMVARTHDGNIHTWPVAENHHLDGILDTSFVPARISETLAHAAQELAIHIAKALDYIGILGVELFIVKNQLYINELAPRPHNSGHITIEANTTSQFEQQVRVLCRLPLGNTDLLSPAVMLNLLGDLWHSNSPSDTPDWEQILAQPGIKLHLYGKQSPRSKRKMGHLTCLAPILDDAIRHIEWARQHLKNTAKSS